MKAPILLPLVLSISTSAMASDVFISEYVEGSSNNKAIEIYNPTDSAVALNGYTLSFYFNDGVSAGTIINLSGSLASGETLVIADDDSDAAILAVADITTSQTFFNGNDAIMLKGSDGAVLDSIGKLGEGIVWGSGDITTQNHTLVRLPSIEAGDTEPGDTYTTAEWIGLSQDDFSRLGSHDFTGGGDSGGSDEDDVLSGVCTNCPDLDKVADASTFDPASYYASVQAEIDAGTNPETIRQILSDTISGQRVLTYSEVWTALTATDEDPANSNNIVLFYSGRSIPKSENGSGPFANNQDYWNREHSWPRSHGFKGSSFEANSDIQHLRPTDISVNSSRGNLDFDNSDAPLAESPENRIDGDSFEPRDAVKGDVARMMLYMDIRYEGAGSDVTPDLTLVNRLTDTNESSLGKLCTLLAWSDEDPVDSIEQRRQAAIYEYQGNRNPFVDHPEWIDLFYSEETCDEATGPDPDPEPEPEPEPTGDALVMLTGVYDGPLSGGTPKGIELVVTRNIDDLSVCGVGGANNGGGSDGEEFTFPAVSAQAGDFIYVASDSTQFENFFGFAPDYVSSAMSINGDDAIEVFCNDEVVDLYGDPNTDGSGEDWEYLDSWAYRVGGVASSQFNLADWNIPGPNVLDGETANATAATPFPIASYVAPADELFMSEYIEGGGNNKAVEIVNLTLAEVDLSQYDLQLYFNGSTSAGQTISLSGTLMPGDVFVIANTGAVAAVQNVADQLSGSLQFNGDDAVVLRNNGEVIDSLGQIGEDPGSYWLGGDVRTQNRTLVRKNTVTTGDTNPFDAFDPSVEWDEFAQDTFDYLGTYGAGSGDNGDTELGVCGDEATFISMVQGAGAASPMRNKTVVLEAAVTHVAPDLSGFWLQEEAGDYDNDDMTSEGIFVSAESLVNSVAVGDVVRLAGSVDEDFGRTFVTASSEALNCGSYSTVPVAISLPMDSADAFEKYEGMLVSSNENWVISNLYGYFDFGELVVSTERLYNPTQLYLPGSNEAAELAEANALNQLIIDDNADGYASQWLLPAGGFGPYNPVRSGDIITSVMGVMDYGYSSYRIRPTSVPGLSSANYRQDIPDVAQGNLKVASFNVLNLFNGDGNGGGFPTSRGADNYDEYQRQIAKIVNALAAMDADVLGLIELENDGFGPDSTIASLVDALNAELGEGTYAYVDVGGDSLGTDQIMSGIIYRPAVVTAQGSAEVLLEENSIVDDQGPLFVDYGNRPSVAQLFTHNESGESFAFDVNHIRSRASSCGAGDDSAEQGNCNLTRTRAVTAINAWLNSTYPETPVIMVGDFNAYAKEDPIQYLTSTGFTNTSASVDGFETHSYTYQGLIGTLDYQFANSQAIEWLVDVTEWNINSDETDAFDYNEEYKPASFLNELLYRASDHDPIVATYMLESAVTAGDWDSDGDIDNEDIRGFFMALLARDDIDMAYDLNKDGRINSRDIAAMRKLCTRVGCATEDQQAGNARGSRTLPRR